MPPALAGSLQVVDSPLLRQQVEAQRLGIKHLKNENNRLKVRHFVLSYWKTATAIFQAFRPKIEFVLQAEKMRALLASLPPLCPPKLPQVSKDASMPPEGLNTGIYRRTDQLLATLLKLSSEVKVVDVTGKTTGQCLCVHTSVCPPTVPFIQQTKKHTWHFTLQSAPVPSWWNRPRGCKTSATLWINSRWRPELLLFTTPPAFHPNTKHVNTSLFQGEVAEHVVSWQPGAKATSDFATFPVSSFVKVNC